jgi:hypothetical protein
MKVPFEEIRIADLDVDLTQPSQEAPGFRRLFLRLSQEPPPEWIKIFERERRFPRRRIWRNAWVVGNHIVVECVPEDLERSQLNHLKEDVAHANKKFSDYAATQKAEIEQQLQKRAEVRKQLEELRGRLKFN